MYDSCPVCAIPFEREPGYFMNAIFFGYILGFLLVVPLNVYLYVRDAPLLWFPVATFLTLTLLSPWLFRYSRALWMHLDEKIDPWSDT